MKTKQQVVSEFRRMEIIDAARTVFARRGFAQGILDEIAKEAGMAKGTVYLYFTSKTEIYKAILDHDMGILKKNTLERIDAAPTLYAKIAAFTLARLENAEAQKEFFQIMDSEQENLNMTRSQYRDFLREPVLRLASAIESGVRKGSVRPVDAERIAWLVADMTRGTIQRRLLGQHDSSVREDSAFITEFVWSALAGVLDEQAS